MDLIFEFIFALIFEGLFEGCMEAGKSKKVPKVIRYLLLAFIAVFFTAIIGLLFFIGFLALREDPLVGIFFILIGLLILVMSILKFRKEYRSRCRENEKKSLCKK